VPAVSRLRVGDFVRLTFQAGTKPRVSQTLLVRVIRITGSRYRGKLVTGAQSAALSELRSGFLVSFAAANIHSIADESAKRHRRGRADPPDKTVRNRSQK
jgi:hypothetical protein